MRKIIFCITTSADGFIAHHGGGRMESYVFGTRLPNSELTLEVSMNMPRTTAGIGACLFALGLAACGLSDSRYDEAQAQAEIRDIEHTWAQVAVTGDASVMERIFADDFVGVSPDGVHYTKSQFMEDTKANPLGFTSNELNGMELRFFGNVAIAQGDETFTKKSGEQGRFVWTDVLVRHDGKWKIAAAQDAMVRVGGKSEGAALFTGGDQAAQSSEQIARTRAAYQAAWRAGDAAGIANLYTQDAQVLYPNQPLVSGHDAIQEYFGDLFAEFPGGEIELTSAEVVVLGQWAFDRGAYHWKGTPKTGGAPLEDTGKYLVVLQRQADGTWRVARDADNSDRPAAQVTRGTT